MFNFIKVSILGVLLFAAYAHPAMARDFADIYSDCGIGSIIAPHNSGVAAVTNVTWDSGTTAISSNISSPDSCKGGQPRTAAFIYQSYPSIEKNLASGSGAYLDTLAVLTKHDPKGKQEFLAALRSDFAKIVADPHYSNKSRFAKSEDLYNLVYKIS